MNNNTFTKTEADMKKLVVSHVELLDRTTLTRKMSKATKRSYTRIYFEEQDIEAAMFLCESEKKKSSVFRKLLKDALKAAGMNVDEKVSWNELAGSLKGERPGFIMTEHKGHELIVTYAVEGTELSKPLVEEQTDVSAIDFRWDEILSQPEAAFTAAKQIAA